MGIHSARAPALPVDDSDGRTVSMEFSLVAIFPSRPRALRRRNIAPTTTLTDGIHVGAAADRCHNSDVDLAYHRRQLWR